ncbi:MAG: DUF7009 family protein [Pyrinomonadaceae bacterium]
MKLRIRGNSLRLRLTKGEVAQMSAGLRIEESIQFGLEPQQRLTYALEVTTDAERLTAEYNDGCIRVLLPASLANEWANSDQIGISGEQSFGNDRPGETLKLLVEKDFACLTERRAEDVDTFPHPFEGIAHCSVRN